MKDELIEMTPYPILERTSEMTDPVKMTTEALAPVSVAIIGGTGDVGAPLTNTLATTPGKDQPNLIIRVITPTVAIAVRFVNAYLTTLIGLVTVGLTSDALPAADFGHLVLRCASLSLAGPAVSLAKDVVTIFSRLEQKFPIATGSI